MPATTPKRDRFDRMSNATLAKALGMAALCLRPRADRDMLVRATRALCTQAEDNLGVGKQEWGE